MELPDTSYEERYWGRGQTVAGVDEAGRGALAGPVVAAAVILPPGARWKAVRDSKQLSPARREQLFAFITQHALSWAVALASVEEINRLNILRATMLAMERAIRQLFPSPEVLLIDGNYFATALRIPAVLLPQGDRRSLSIAAASIIAKVWRDRWMCEVAHKCYPAYGFAQHKGYGTRQHRAILVQRGASKLHRKKFIQRILGQNGGPLFEEHLDY